MLNKKRRQNYENGIHAVGRRVRGYLESPKIPTGAGVIQILIK